MWSHGGVTGAWDCGSLDTTEEALVRQCWGWSRTSEGDPVPRTRTPSRKTTLSAARLLSSGTAIHWALDAQRLLGEDWGMAADVWSATSWTELRRDGLAYDATRLRGEDPPLHHVTRVLQGAPGPVLAVS